MNYGSNELGENYWRTDGTERDCSLNQDSARVVINAGRGGKLFHTHHYILEGLHFNACASNMELSSGLVYANMTQKKNFLPPFLNCDIRLSPIGSFRQSRS